MDLMPLLVLAVIVSLLVHWRISSFGNANGTIVGTMVGVQFLATCIRHHFDIRVLQNAHFLVGNTALLSIVVAATIGALMHSLKDESKDTKTP